MPTWERRPAWAGESDAPHPLRAKASIVFQKTDRRRVEMDETYMGGYRALAGGRSTKNKTPVVALVQRGGDMRSMVMERVTGDNLNAAIREHVEVGSIVCTDDYLPYRRMPKIFTHKAVKHGRKEYAQKEGDFTVHEYR